MTFSLDARAAHWGDRTAVVDVSEARRDEEAETIDRDRYSYAELAAIADRFAASLADRDVDAGDTVCVVSRNRVRVLALFFACRRLGATFAPLSHRLTPKTVSRPLERLEPAIVVTESAQRDLTRAVQHAKTVAFDELGRSGEAGTDLDSATDLESRSTDGTPLVTLHDDPGGTDSNRGADPDPDAAVTFSERAVEANCRAVVTTWGLGRADCTPLLLPLSAPDGLLRTALPALYSGGTLLLDRAFDPGDTLEAIRREPVTVLVGRRAELRDLAANDDADALGALEWVVGEGPVSEEVRNAFLERGVPVAGAYGCPACPTALAQPVGGGIGGDTEVEAGSTTETEPGDGGVGHPLFDCRVRLVADDSVVEGAGEGRLEVAGPMVADGASGSDDAEAATDWVATGDRFRRDEDGRYYPVDFEDDVAGAVDES
ncbi:class I adenylate-forming enzyme family protein [Halomontanus rarus]|uniref:class I adenylate-forming enzyme family protein n=1 Tax=Halomontanus rarus TaxID=3034020 RepID=UPI0023E861CE|nr:class I adenylate-forming enzyme family protein [Halovivax sp. TS33]